MTAHPGQGARRGAVALAFAVLMAGCGGGGGGGGGETTTTEPATPTGPTNPATPTNPTSPTTPTSPTPPTSPPTPGEPANPTSPTAPTTPTTPAPSPPQPGVLRSLTAWAGAPDPGGAGDRDGTSSAARFARPTSVAAASDGSYWVTEFDSPRIRRIDAEGRVTTVLDAGAWGLAIDVDGRRVVLNHPHTLLAAPSGGVFVAMTQFRLNPDGSAVGDGPLAVLHLAPGGQPRLLVLPDPAHGVGAGASALALDRQGRLYIAAGCSIWRTDGEVLAAPRPRGVQRVYPGTAPACGFESLTKSVTGLTTDADDRVVFALGRGEVLRLEHDLRVTTLARASATPAYGCGDMAMDRQGGLLLTSEKAVLRLDASGREHVVAGSPSHGGWLDGSAESARFSSLCGLAIDAQGRIVLVDQDSHNVRRIESDGRVITLAGLAPQVGYRDGIGQDALFSRYFSVGTGLGDEVLVAEFDNGTVRGVDAVRRVSTLAGVPRAPGDFTSTGSDGPVATARLGGPTQALKTADGSVWMADGSKLRRLGTDGIVRTVATSNDRSAWALALDRAGDVVVVWGSFSVGLSGPGDTYIHFERYSARTPETAPVRMAVLVPDDLRQRTGSMPLRGLCILPDGSFVYTQANAVLRRAADGTVALLAGSPDQWEYGGADGPAAAVRFIAPEGLACDDTGGIYVADSGNHIVRYIDAQRRVRTVLGTPGQAGHRFDALPGELRSPSSLALVPGGLVVATGMGLVRAGF